jgi:hypothetical protein
MGDSSTPFTASPKSTSGKLPLAELKERHAAARRTLDKVLKSDRYLALLELLIQAANAPALTAALMDQIARRVQQTRDTTFKETADRDLEGKPFLDAQGKPVRKRVNHTLAIGSLGGATMDNEWNYVQTKLMRALGVVAVENQARI